MKQKVTSIFLLATLVLSLLVGCSTDEGNSSNYPVESPSSVSSGIVGSPQSTDSVEQSSADADDSGVEAEDPSGSNGQSNMTGQEIDQPVSSTLPTEIAAATSFSLSDVKPYSGSAYVAINGNIPYFTSSELTTTSFELYSALDSLSRCGTAYACIGQDLMPTEERGSIGSVKPSGWHTVRYNGVVDGNYLYNRCHLIGFQLSGENANERNLITGTRYLNIDGMLPFENMVADYVQETNNHVLYRVTPVFEGDNLLAAGVLMEGYSVEDDGDGICFCIFAYNVQPGVTINYATGDSALDGVASTSGSDPSVVQEPSSDTQAGTSTVEAHYVLNNNTKKFHLPSCSSADDIKASNKEEYSGVIHDAPSNKPKRLNEVMWDHNRRILRRSTPRSIGQITIWSSMDI